LQARARGVGYVVLLFGGLTTLLLLSVLTLLLHLFRYLVIPLHSFSVLLLLLLLHALLLLHSMYCQLVLVLYPHPSAV
jgi:hypothetical protein